MHHTIVRKEVDLHLAVGINIIAEGLVFLLPFDDASTPCGDPHLVIAGAHSIGPWFMHGCIALCIDGPLFCIRVIVTRSTTGGTPDIFTITYNRVDHIIGQSAIELGEGFKLSARVAVHSSQGTDPDITGKFTYIDG